MYHGIIMFIDSDITSIEIARDKLRQGGTRGAGIGSGMLTRQLQARRYLDTFLVLLELLFTLVGYLPLKQLITDFVKARSTSLPKFPSPWPRIPFYRPIGLCGTM
ncbi:hypothetical protein IAQ61_006445 [Plenodomus lingam]|uniref:uncharacterized protein n=1 Tax=Leptosphaeria maculans TaxID=5022 RepID=UPI00332C39CA|nr:hypothetical protein IAQ61_006445 [Plenodomus lingam]